MSVAFTPVQWNRNKLIYDVALIALAGLYLYAFLEWAPPVAGHERPADTAILRMRAFGSCAFLMLTAVLCIGPLAVLDKRFMPLLYNRRHFGVLTFLVALAHARFVLDWYFAFSPTPKLAALLGSNVNWSGLVGLPFEWFGIFALLVLAVMAATSHDFWLDFLGPRLWKSLHTLIYLAYVAVVAHVAFGTLLDDRGWTFTGVVVVSAALVAGLHVAAALRGRADGRRTDTRDGWVSAGRIADFVDGRARSVTLPDGTRAAVFRTGNRLAALSNACAHQNGPLAEGRVLRGCITCPWHGYQYRLEDGCSPPPFTEKVPTYNLRIDADEIFVSITANPPGTRVEPLHIEGATA